MEQDVNDEAEWARLWEDIERARRGELVIPPPPPPTLEDVLSTLEQSVATPRRTGHVHVRSSAEADRATFLDAVATRGEELGYHVVRLPRLEAGQGLKIEGVRLVDDVDEVGTEHDGDPEPIVMSFGEGLSIAADLAPDPGLMIIADDIHEADRGAFLSLASGVAGLRFEGHAVWFFTGRSTGGDEQLDPDIQSIVRSAWWVVLP